MQNKKILLAVVTSFLVSTCIFAQSKKAVPHLSHKTAKGVIKRPKHLTGATNSSALLDYPVSDSAYSFNYKGESYSGYYIQDMNMRYSLQDTGTPSTSAINQNLYLIHSCSVVFDTLLDAYSNNAYPLNIVKNVNVDTLTILLGHENLSGTNDTLIIQIDSVGYNDYPTNKVLWSKTIITDTGISPHNSWTYAYNLVVPVNYALLNSKKFCVTLQYYGSKLDTMGFTSGYPINTSCNGSDFPDTTSIGHKYNTKLIANSYLEGWQYFFPSATKTIIPTSYGTGDSLYYLCIATATNDTMLFLVGFQDICISAQVSFNSTAGGISGKTYVNKGSNCIYDTTDLPVPYVPLEAIDSLNNIVATAYSDYYGNYTLSPLNKGSHYRIKIDSVSGSSYKIICPVSGVDSAIPPSVNNNLAITCSGGIDLMGYLSACIDTPTFGQVQVNACVYNNGCLPANATLKLVLDTAMHFSASDVIADTLPIVSGDTLIWHYNGLPYGTTNPCVYLTGTIDNLPNGDSVHIQMIVDPINGDSIPGNNVVSYWAPVFPHNCIGLPYDPNGKTVSPVGTISADQRLTYNIHFQNTGTAPAHNVVVVDTLSPSLDVTTLEILSSSNPMSLQISGGNVATFSFNNINLPDTGTSKTTSIGSVTYTIKPISNVKAGAQIANNAGIYFDANSPVYTNTTISTINSSPTGINPLSPLLNLSCFPNPFTTSTSIVFNTNNKHYLEVDDITGRKIETFECTCKEYTLQRNNLAPGIYIIKAFDQEQKFIATAKIVAE